MAVFKRVNDQYTITVDAYEANGDEFVVGDVVAYDVQTKEITKIEDEEELQEAAEGGLTILILAQSDAVTYKTGTGYKEYKTSRIIDFADHITAAATKKITGYVVKDITNVQF